MRFTVSASLIAAIALLQGCSKPPADDNAALDAVPVSQSADAKAPPADNVDTLDGSKFASFKTDVAAGEKVFMACRTCHSTKPGINMTGPSLHGLQGHHSGQIPGYKYSEANKASGITWTNEKLFQYLENPQRVVPGTKMSYVGVKDPQQRADLVAYLDTLK